jgi:pimeloyl-ACP methyl ester carboxylesterase
MISGTLPVNGIELAYQIHGQRDRPVMMMIQGLGMPLSGWPPELIQQFVDSGYCVLLFDNRDAGQSDTMDHLGVPSVARLYMRRIIGLSVNAPYSLEDMADDALGLLDALHIDRVHLVGISMGGMIAQALAIRAMHRLKTLTSWMSTTGDWGLKGPTWKVTRQLLSRPKGTSLDARIEFSCQTWRLIGSPGFPASDDHILNTVKRIYSRRITNDGIARQSAAIVASPGRSEALRGVTVPTLVIHGDADPLVHLSGGVATAKAMPRARLHVIKGLGHDLPVPLYDTFRRLITRHASSAEGSEHESVAGA